MATWTTFSHNFTINPETSPILYEPEMKLCGSNGMRMFIPSPITYPLLILLLSLVIAYNLHVSILYLRYL